MDKIDKKALAWKAITLVCGTGVGIATERFLAFLWQKSRGEEAPINPADRHTSWPVALSWAVATGVGVGIARVVANRGAAAVWEAAIDETPPGIQPAA